MKLRHLFIAGTLALSASAIAMEAQARGTQAQAGATESFRAGHNADVVRKVQEKLNAAGHDVGPVDGIAGPRTAQALRSYQQSKGLSATGRLDQETLASLGIDAGAVGATPGSTTEREVGSRSGAERQQPSQGGSSTRY
ncbi:MAG TPA: peptidoglycan-binding domain-containing protein [Burkholderiales bacterium]|nr:peptidoglycan-binding domain-containing protein [Burkholderiales bacterium]